MIGVHEFFAFAPGPTSHIRALHPHPSPHPLLIARCDVSWTNFPTRHTLTMTACIVVDTVSVNGFSCDHQLMHGLIKNIDNGTTLACLPVFPSTVSTKLTTRRGFSVGPCMSMAYHQATVFRSLGVVLTGRLMKSYRLPVRSVSSLFFSKASRLVRRRNSSSCCREVFGSCLRPPLPLGDLLALPREYVACFECYLLLYTNVYFVYLVWVCYVMLVAACGGVFPRLNCVNSQINSS